MDDLVQLMQKNLVISRNSCLIHDVEYLIWGFENNVPKLDYSVYKARLDMYESYHQMYNEIIKILREKKQVENIIEMMPLIDDYLESR